MTDGFTEGRLIDCDQCGRPVRLFGHNDVISWTCESCRQGKQPTLLEQWPLDETNTEYDPTRARIPYA